MWAERWLRWTEERRELDRDLRRDMREASPMIEALRFLSLARNDNGEPRLRLPTIDLDGAANDFLTGK